MRIVFVTYVTPTIENCRAASALPFHIAKHREEGIELVVYSFNHNRISPDGIREVEEQLNCTIKVVPEARWIGWLIKFHLLFVRMLLRRPFVNYIKLPRKIVKEIKAHNSNSIWVYGEELSQVVKQFTGYRIVHTLPDCESLYYKRMMQADFVKNNRMMLWRQKVMYPKYRRMERNFVVSPQVTYHLVGDADAKELRSICSGVDAKFIRHPHYEVRDVNREIRFGDPIRLLVAGQYNLYMQSTADEWFLKMSEAKDLCKHYIITFLGRGWEPTVLMLREAGFKVNHITFAPDYIEEVCRHDIQLTPIAIGTGTKGKVLDAIANGLLVIGTTYAMENIAVKNGESCIVCDSSKDVIEILREIPNNVENFESIATLGRKSVLTAHDRERMSKQFFELFL